MELVTEICKGKNNINSCPFKGKQNELDLRKPHRKQPGAAVIRAEPGLSATKITRPAPDI